MSLNDIIINASRYQSVWRKPIVTVSIDDVNVSRGKLHV